MNEVDFDFDFFFSLSDTTVASATERSGIGSVGGSSSASATPLHAASASQLMAGGGHLDDPSEEPLAMGGLEQFEDEDEDEDEALGALKIEDEQ
jgi:hypothetical protein